MKNLIYTLIAFVIITNVSATSDPFSEKKKLISKAISLTEANICNPSFLETDQWKNFVTHMSSDEILQLDEKEFVLAFNLAAKELPFTHFYLNYSKGKKNRLKVEKAFELEEVDSRTVILHVRRFASNASLMTDLVREIAAKNYENLIIDVRGNRGGTLDAAVVLGMFLTNESIDAGTYINRSWFLAENRYPNSEDIASFPYLMKMDYAGFKEAAQKPAFRMVLPPHQNPTYKGKVFVLTNKSTASTCEPFVHILKEKGVAQIIGEPTAGAMLSGQSFKLSKNISLFLPVQDYITSNGTRLDKLGVTPTIETSSEDALDEALKHIK